MVSLDFDDIQGNILRGYGYPVAVYLFLEVPDAPSGRAFLGEIAGSLQNGAPWEKPGPATTTNLAVTFAGLRALGVPASILDTLPPAFREPIRERAARLFDDTGPSDPEHWDEGVGTERSHLLVTVNGREEAGDAFTDEVAAVMAMAERHGLPTVHCQDAHTLAHRREHFGWADGFSQPAVEGAHGTKRQGDGVPTEDGWRDLKAGEFVHGYEDEDGQTISGPAADLLRNGSYMVYRKLYQDIVAFRAQLHEDALAYGRSLPDDPPLDHHQLYELLAAKVVGRWRDGEPIEISPRRADEESRSLGEQAIKDPPNDFRYRSREPDRSDESGFRCPVGAHIRRTNPRDALGWDGALSARHRIIRRGMPYGRFRPFEEGQEDDGVDRGLVFVCFNTSLERQFEVIQRQWCIDGNAFGLGNDKDYLLGDTGVGLPTTGEAGGGPTCPPGDGRISTGRVVIQGSPPHYVEARPPVVRTKGCEYLLMPGIRAVRGLAAGRWDDGGTSSPDERAAIDRVVQLTRSKHERDYEPDIRPMLRDQHAKPHGCVRAEFTVGPDVPPELRHGLFAEPGTYQAWIRFSSSAAGPKLRSDRKRDAHGMAIKVLGVGGPKVLAAERDASTQDFVLANSKVFFCPNAHEYIELASRANEGSILRFFIGWNPTKWRLRLLFNLLVATTRAVHNPLGIRYWSQTASALGPLAVKYSTRPQGRGGNRKPPSRGDDYLEEAMRRQLDSGEARFDFMVQQQGAPERMPVDDPTVRWSERASPFRTVATIRIPPQEFTSEARKAFAENLSFTPWHSLPAHQPLGSINRVRRDVYDDIARLRHEANGVPRVEPTDEAPE